MTAPVAPMEARCEHCHDTGALSKWTGGDLDCTHCDAAEKRGALYATVEAARKVAMGEYRLASFDAVWLAYQLGQAAPVAQLAEQKPVAYMAFAKNGNVRIWAGKDNLGAKDAAEKDGLVLQPVYTVPQPAQQVEAVGRVPVAWIAPRLLESLKISRENARVPSNHSVAVQAAQRETWDLPLYAAPSAANGAVGEMPEPGPIFVNLPEPIFTSHHMGAPDEHYFSADQLRAAVLAERDACAKECDFQANWAKGEAEDKDNSVRYRNENRERQTAAELCAGSIRART